MTTEQVSELLVCWKNGDNAAFDKLVPIVYSELRRIARRAMRRENPGHTLETTALVNEAYLRLVDQSGVAWEGRNHFFAVAAQVMRRVLIDHARRGRYAKRGGGAFKVALSDAGPLAANGRTAEIVALDDALTALARYDERKCRIVELRFFAGLSVTETAEVIGVAPVTVMREWRAARAWLKTALVPPVE